MEKTFIHDEEESGERKKKTLKTTYNFCRKQTVFFSRKREQFCYKKKIPFHGILEMNTHTKEYRSCCTYIKKIIKR